METKIKEENLDSIERKFCPECNEDVISDNNTGDLICSNCGLIIESSIIDQGVEWRAFSSEESDRKARVGLPSTFTLHDKGLSTIIDWRDRDAFGKKLSPHNRAEAYRLRKWNIRMRIHSSLDRNLAYAMSELDRLSSQLNIQRNIKETSAMIYRKTIEKKLIKGRSIEAMIASSIYVACRLAKIPHTLDEFSNYSRINKRDLGRCFRLIIKELSLHILTPMPIQFIPRFANELHLSTETQNIAIKILNYAKKIGITTGKDPTGLASASLYIASIKNKEKCTQREIAKIANVTEVTVRNRYKELIKRLKIKMIVHDD